jgi:hypothetical protein
MPGDGLPQDLDRLFADGAADRVLDVDVPPGSLVVPKDSEGATPPAYWLSDEPSGPDLWVRLRRAHARSGLWPLFVTPLFESEDRPWVTGEVVPQPVADIGRLGADEVLEGFWTAWIGDERDLEPADGDPLPELVPFGRRWPGLAAATEPGQDPDDFVDQYVRENDDGTSRIMLVAAPRSADVLTAIGWYGAANYTLDTFLLSSVIRSWEERFGARLVEIGFDTIHLAVAAPPTSSGHSERVAAEHFAFCPDNIVQGAAPTIRAYTAEQVQSKTGWSFWWD